MAVPGIPFYSFSDPAVMQHILVKHRDNYSRGKRWSNIVGYLGGNGLISSDGDFWKRQRQCMAPFFQRAALEGYCGIFVENTRQMAAQWKRVSGSTPINISEAMMELTLINICDSLFGYDIRSEALRFSVAMRDAFDFIQYQINHPFSAPLWLPTRRNRRFRKQVAIADIMARTIITDFKYSEKPGVLQALLHDADNTDMQLRDEIITLLMAGHDTTATMLAWALHLLATHPEALHTVKEELASVLGGNLPTVPDLDKLVYTRMIVDETLRLYPSVWAMHRMAKETDEINGYTVRQGCSIALPVYVTHRDPEFWQCPDYFYPEHFTEATSSTRPKHAYIPFGAGERFCLGMQLALMESMAVLSTLLQHLTPNRCNDVETTPKIAFTLQSSTDIRLNMTSN